MPLYDRLRNGTAPRLLSKYKTGTVEIGRPVTTPGAEPWDPPTTSVFWSKVYAVVTGVSQKYVDGETVVMSDRMVIFQSPASFDTEAGDQMRIDGDVVSVLMIMPVLAAGEPVVSKVVVRG